jgi:hypothetical protein
MNEIVVTGSPVWRPTRPGREQINKEYDVYVQA